MKINPLTAALSWANRVNEKRDGSQNQNRDSQRDQRQKDSQKDPQQDPKEFEGKVRSAIDAFGTESKAQNHGLSIDQVGTGPGLKVVLKDGTGAIVRQFTGEEFLQLRESADLDTRPRGKILDQKF